MICEQFTLPNGLRIVFQEDKSIHTIHCGLMVNAGSRDEQRNEHGIAHLIEHCLFKGTSNRKAFHILSRLDSVGGEINAYTTKEETCVYASALCEHFERAAELLVDIMFYSTFPPKEIEKEKTVVTDEINSYKENPEEMLLDEFESDFFPDQSLGRSILGTKARIAKYDQKKIQSFINRLYTTDQIVFSVVGNISRKKLLRFCEKHLAPVSSSVRKTAMRPLPAIAQFDTSKSKNVHQLHAILGGKTVGLKSEQRRIMVLLNNILGGPALNSRLNLNIRERLGYCYYIESSFSPLSDVGLFQIYFGTDYKHTPKTMDLVRKELDSLMEKKINERALSASKKQLLGQMALGQEQRSNMMLALAKSVLHFNVVDTFSEIEDRVMAISADDVQDLAIEVFDQSNISKLIYAPRVKK